MIYSRPDNDSSQLRRNTSNGNNRLADFLALGLSGFILVLGLRLFAPFFEPIAWAIILALFFYPINLWLTNHLKITHSIAALAMCVLIILFIIIPVFALLGSLTTEVLRVYSGIQSHLQSGDFSVLPDQTKYPYLYKLASRAFETLRANEATVKGTIIGLSKNMGEFFLRQGTVVFKNIANVIFSAALMLVTLYYLFRDGERMLNTFKSLLPMKDQTVDKFTHLTADVLSATLYGNLMTAAIQGALGIFILWVLGFSAPLLWGMVMGLGTFIPMVGTAIVWVPATLYLFLTGLYLKGAILLSFSVLVISQIDYFLRPYFISGKTQLHSLFLFFSILGGLQTFGFLGLILGPILIALCVSILELYKMNLLGRTRQNE